jgi:hypothetical protein
MNRIILLICLLSTQFGYSQELDFEEHQINNFIKGSKSFIVENFDDEIKKDILVFPIEEEGFGIYQNKDSLNFELKKFSLNQKIIYITNANYYSSLKNDLIVFSDSNIHILKNELDSFTQTISFPSLYIPKKVIKTHDDHKFLMLDTNGSVFKIQIDTLSYSVDTVHFVNEISSMETINTPDSTFIYCYSSDSVRLSFLTYVNDSLLFEQEVNNLLVNSQFSIVQNQPRKVILSSFETDSLFQVQFTETNYSINYINSEYNNTPILKSYHQNDTLIVDLLDFSIIDENHDTILQKYSCNVLKRVSVYSETIMSDEFILDYLDPNVLLIESNMDIYPDNELIVFSDESDKVIIYDDSNNYFNLSITNLDDQISGTVVDFDSDGDLDVVAYLTINGYGGGFKDRSGAEVVLFENKGDYRFINHTMHRTDSKQDISVSPLISNMGGRINVIVDLHSRARVLRVWDKGNGKIGSNEIGRVAGSFFPSGGHDPKGLFEEDIDNDGDLDIIAVYGENAKVIVFGNVNDTLKYFHNNYGLGTMGSEIGGDLNFVDYYNLGYKNFFMGIDYLNHPVSHDRIFMLKVSKVDFKEQNEQSSLGVNNNLEGTWYSPSKKNCNASLVDIDFDGDLDFVYWKPKRDNQTNLYDSVLNFAYNTPTQLGDSSFYSFRNENSQAFNMYYESKRIFAPDVLEHHRDFQVLDLTNTYRPIIIPAWGHRYGKKRSVYIKREIGFENVECDWLRNFSKDLLPFVKDFDHDKDEDIVFVNHSKGLSFYENKTCNSKATIDTTICEPILSPSGDFLIEKSGVYYDVLQNYKGCDSTLKIIVKQLNTYGDLNTVWVCSEYIAPSGKVYEESGVYYDTVPNSLNCDSIIRIILSVNNKNINLNPIVCDSFVSPSKKHIWTESGTYYDTTLNNYNCHNYYQVDLEIENIDANIYHENNAMKINNLGSDYDSVFWFDCYSDSLVSSNPDEFIPDGFGLYTAVLKSNKCLDTLPCVNYKNSNFESDYFEVYNLDDNNLELVFNGDIKDMHVFISDATGRVIRNIESVDNSKKCLINMSDVRSGVYIVSVSFETGVNSKKIIWN